MGDSKPAPPKSTINEAALAAVMAIPHTLKNMHGSTAGAGSGDFHQYRGFRRTEQNRIAEMDAQAKKEEEEAEFQKRRAERLAEVDSKTAKKSAKRKKQKEKEKERKQSTKLQRRSASPVAPVNSEASSTAPPAADSGAGPSGAVATPSGASVRAALAAQRPFDALYDSLAASVAARGPATLTEDQRTRLASAFEGLQLGADASRQLIAACGQRGVTLEVLPDDAFDALPAELPRPRGPAEYFRITAPAPLTFVVLADGAPFLSYAQPKPV